MRGLGRMMGCVVFGCVTAVAGSAFAQDATTPATDEQCDVFRADGVTKGLYGLCIAICEAPPAANDGCEPAEDANGELIPQSLEGCRPATSNLISRFQAKAAETDPALPCVAVPPDATCPCWEQAEVDAAAAVGWCSLGGDGKPLTISNLYTAGTNWYVGAFCSVGKGRKRVMLSITDEELAQCEYSIQTACHP